MSKFDSFMKDLESASVLELNDLVKAIEEKFGVSAAAVASAGPATGAPAAEETKYLHCGAGFCRRTKNRRHEDR